MKMLKGSDYYLRGRTTIAQLLKTTENHDCEGNEK